MSNYRLSLIFSVLILSLLVWEAWKTDYSKPQQSSVQQTRDNGSVTIEDVPSLENASAIDAATPRIISNNSELPSVGESASVQGAKLLKVSTDLYQIDIDTSGGSIVRTLLNEYPNTLDDPDSKFELMGTSVGNYFVAQSGLLAVDQAASPNHKAIYTAQSSEYVMQEGSNSLVIPLLWEKDGIRVEKTFTFNRGTYLIDVSHKVTNSSGKVWKGRQYRQLVRSEPTKKAGNNSMMVTYTGSAYYSSEEYYQKVSFDDITDDKLSVDTTNGWIAMLQHYYLATWIPNRNEKNHFYSNVTNKSIQPRYIIGAYSPMVSLQSGESFDFTSGFLAGPKLQNKLSDIAQGLELSVDYTFLTIIAKPIFWVLTHIHNVVGNWGWSIIFLTILIKILFFYPSAKSYRSMANMRKLTPRIQAMKERYADDRQGMNQAMMEMYKKEKVNPLGGCLPILIQMPVFISLYWVLLEAVELRHAPFMFWINDLSAMDQFFVLPVLMGISMFFQQKLNPQPPDPMQAKIMMSLPFVFTVFFAFFPSGLVLYWVVNNILSIAQQWYITNQIENET